VFQHGIQIDRGTANGVSVEGEAYTMNTITDLRVEIGCRWVVSGILNIDGENSYTIEVDYGNGNCDGIATITVNNYSFNITMQ